MAVTSLLQWMVIWNQEPNKLSLGSLFSGVLQQLEKKLGEVSERRMVCRAKEKEKKPLTQGTMSVEW